MDPAKKRCDNIIHILVFETGKSDLPPSYEKIKQEDDMLPKYEDLQNV